MLELFLDLLRFALGVVILLGLCWGFSESRRHVQWRLVGMGLAFTFALGLLILKMPFAAPVLETVTAFFVQLLDFAEAGAIFVFGEVLVTDGSFGAIFAFKILPTIIFFSAFTSVLYYLNILQYLVYAFAWLMSRTMRLSGAESLAAAANVFVGMTEAPLVVKPYVKDMSRSELLCLMTVGLATIAGGVFGAYLIFLGGDDPKSQIYFGRHLLVASLLSAPTAIICAKILLPETEETDRDLFVSRNELGDGVFDAAMKGGTQGISLALNVAGALIIFVGFIALVNYILSVWVGSWSGLNSFVMTETGGLYGELSLQVIFSLVFAPVAWLIGVEPGQIMIAGQLLGDKLVINEFVAYKSMGNYISEGLLHDERSILVLTYALCGFSNFSSMGIILGGVSVIAPERREELARLAPRALLGGTVACLITGAFAGLLTL